MQDPISSRAAYDNIIDNFGRSTNIYMIDTDYGNDNFKYQTVFSVVVSYPEVGNFYGSFNKNGKELGAINVPCEYVGAGCGGYGILVDKKDEVQTLKTGESAKTVDLCWDFLKYIISKDGQNIAGREGYIQPVLKELADTGDWVQAYDGKIDSKAFATAHELRLDTFCFANPIARNDLRTHVVSFYRELFAPNRTNYNDILETAIREVNQDLKKA